MDIQKYIDSKIGNIARKIQDEFNESDHPRDKGGKFTSKGNEGSGSTKSDEELLEGLDDYGEKLLEYASDIDTANDALRALNWDTYDYDDLEQAQTALKEAISQNPKAAKELWESTSNKEEVREDDDYDRALDEANHVLGQFQSSGIDMESAWADLGVDMSNTPEAYREEVFGMMLMNEPELLKKSKDYIERYRSGRQEKSEQIDVPFFGGPEAEKEDPEKGDALNKYAVELENAGADPKEIHRLNREGDLEGMKKLLGETSKEKEAREELSNEAYNRVPVREDIEKFVKDNDESMYWFKNPENLKKHRYWMKNELSKFKSGIVEELKDKQSTLRVQYNGKDAELESDIKDLNSTLEYIEQNIQKINKALGLKK